MFFSADKFITLSPWVNECRVTAKGTGSAVGVSTPLPVTVSKSLNLSVPHILIWKKAIIEVAHDWVL